jgi:hypothetical protein
VGEAADAPVLGRHDVAVLRGEIQVPLSAFRAGRVQLALTQPPLYGRWPQPALEVSRVVAAVRGDDDLNTRGTRSTQQLANVLVQADPVAMSSAAVATAAWLPAALATTTIRAKPIASPRFSVVVASPLATPCSAGATRTRQPAAHEDLQNPRRERPAVLRQHPPRRAEVHADPALAGAAGQRRDLAAPARKGNLLSIRSEDPNAGSPGCSTRLSPRHAPAISKPARSAAAHSF